MRCQNPAGADAAGAVLGGSYIDWLNSIPMSIQCLPSLHGILVFEVMKSSVVFNNRSSTLGKLQAASFFSTKR